ncbi:MAG: helical backbone metal receptor, partial [Pseudomonadota bacterium]|nr:helical backbone metal receptor [Pseudomonadota bacterium]
MIRCFFAFALMLCACFAVASKPIERIVALSPSSTEMLFEMGLGKRVVGTVEWADFPEAAKAIPRIGSYAGINIEALIALQPDIVVAWKSGNKESDLQKLEALGVNVLYIDPKTMDAVADDMERLGQAVGEPQAGKDAAGRFRDRYSALKHQFANADPVRVFYQLSYEPLRTVGQGSWV